MRSRACGEWYYHTRPVSSATGLEFRHVSRSFGAVQALTDVSFKAYAGEVIGLVGDNGAGKSTTLRAISGLLRPRRGEILETLGPRTSPHYRVRWDDGHESIFSPGPATHIRRSLERQRETPTCVQPLIEILADAGQFLELRRRRLGEVEEVGLGPLHALQAVAKRGAPLRVPVGSGRGLVDGGRGEVDALDGTASPCSSKSRVK